MIGSAVGYALGAPFEFGPAGQHAQQFPEPVVGRTGEMIGGGIGWAAGEFTDDTQMAIAQAESILAFDGVDGSDLFECFRLRAGTARDPRPATCPGRPEVAGGVRACRVPTSTAQPGTPGTSVMSSGGRSRAVATMGRPGRSREPSVGDRAGEPRTHPRRTAREPTATRP